MTKSSDKKASTVQKSAKSKQKAEKIFHPASRKAGQMEREALRKAKLANKLVKRGKKQTLQADRYALFLHAIPPETTSLTLMDLHELVQSLWLTRHDLGLEEERKARRKGRPKSAKEAQLEELKRLDAEEYRTGLDLPDFTDASNLALFRKWDGVDVSYLYILRFIRISGEFPEVVHVARVGRDKLPTTDGASIPKSSADDATRMDMDEISEL